MSELGDNQPDPIREDFYGTELDSHPDLIKALEMLSESFVREGNSDKPHSLEDLDKSLTRIGEAVKKRAQYSEIDHSNITDTSGNRHKAGVYSLVASNEEGGIKNQVDASVHDKLDWKKVQSVDRFGTKASIYTDDIEAVTLQYSLINPERNVAFDFLLQKAIGKPEYDFSFSHRKNDQPFLSELSLNLNVDVEKHYPPMDAVVNKILNTANAVFVNPQNTREQTQAKA